MPEMDRTKVVAVVNRLLEAELAGVVRYTPLLISGVRLRPNFHRLVLARASQRVAAPCETGRCMDHGPGCRATLQGTQPQPHLPSSNLVTG